jgi:hypothetical protein
MSKLKRLSISATVNLAACAAACFLLLVSVKAYAVPSFARQTGEACQACHISFPELTPFGRYFKLTGYTLGSRKLFPFAVMGQASITHAAKDSDNSGAVVVPRNDEFNLSSASVFLAGKATDHIGAFVQWTYDNLAHHGAMDNTDIRLTNRVKLKDTELLYGLTLNNNPTVQDVWNSTPAFGFPFTTSPVALTPAASTLIDGGLAQQVAGPGGYFYWNKTLYAELSFYRTADKFFSVLRQGQDTDTPGGVNTLDGYNSYWRVALNHEWGAHALTVGTYGMIADKFPDNTIPEGPSDRFTDYAVDAQYQYITDPHTFTAQATWIHENQDYRASFPNPIGAGPTPANASDTLKTFKLKGTYYYQRKYGANVAYFQTTGSIDEGLYPDNPGNSPDSRGYILELDYVPIQNVRLMLQYTGFFKFDGGTLNIDGNGRNAADNNSLFFNVWFAF